MFISTVAAGEQTSTGSVNPFPVLSGRLRDLVESFSVPRHYRSQPRANRRAHQQISDLLTMYGYDVMTQGPFRNLIGVPPAGARTRLPAVCAHYDSVANTPGADDNASALAVMLEVARIAAERDVAIIVIAFNAEEDNLAGSRDFAACYRTSGLSISVAHVLEMVGFTAVHQRAPRLPRWMGRVPTAGDFIGICSNRRSAPFLDDVIEAAACSFSPPTVGLEVFWGAERWLPDINRSDHAALWQRGIAALLWTDTAEFRNPNYHLPTDTPDTLDYLFMARVTSLLLRTVGLSTASIEEEA